MRYFLLIALFCVSTLFASEQIAKEQGCFECHALRGPKKAPGFTGAAMHARMSSNPKEFLIRVIKEGSSGTRPMFQGQVMPPYGHLKDSTIESLAEWILSLSNSKRGMMPQGKRMRGQGMMN